MSYRVTNRTDASIILEDIGLSLEKGGTQVISNQLYDQSKHIHEFHGRIRIEKIYETPISIEMNIKNTSPESILEPIGSALIEPDPIQPAPQLETSPNDGLALKMMHDMNEALHIMKEMNARMAQTVEFLARSPRPFHSSDDLQPNEMYRISHPKAEPEPVFIPSRILPKEADVHINSENGSSSADDFDDTAAALKNLRKKK